MIRAARMARMTMTIPTAMPMTAPVPMPECEVELGSAMALEVGELVWMGTLLIGVPLTLLAEDLPERLLLLRT